MTEQDATALHFVADDDEFVPMSDREADAVAGLLAGLAEIEQPAEPAISLDQFQQRVAAGEWNDAIQDAAPAFFIAPDAAGCPSLWRANGDYPELIANQTLLDRMHSLLWPAVVTHFTGQAAS